MKKIILVLLILLAGCSSTAKKEPSGLYSCKLPDGTTLDAKIDGSKLVLGVGSKEAMELEFIKSEGDKFVIKGNEQNGFTYNSKDDTLKFFDVTGGDSGADCSIKK